jgi:hypothetical protein
MDKGKGMKIPQGYWKVGVTASDREYAKVAYLYTETLITKSANTNLILAMAMGVPVSTVKERIRECRERGLITLPGKGKRGLLTLKACSLLEMENNMPIPQGDITTSEILVPEVVQDPVQVLDEEVLPEATDED